MVLWKLCNYLWAVTSEIIEMVVFILAVAFILTAVCSNFLCSRLITTC
jgi:hypothetical protein